MEIDMLGINEKEKKEDLTLEEYEIILQLLNQTNFRPGQSAIVARVEKIMKKIQDKFPAPQKE